MTDVSRMSGELECVGSARRSSAAEREIRDALVSHLRQTMPSARIVHEVPVGGCRADVAAIDLERIALFEIKSERDTLERAARQMETFADCAHAAVLVAHIKWFERRAHDGYLRWIGPEMPFPSAVWAYPEPDPAPNGYGWHRWAMPRERYLPPHSLDLLSLLWLDEMRIEAGRHGICGMASKTRAEVMRALNWRLTGAEICRAACRQLRSRPFPEGDAPIVEASPLEDIEP